MSDFLDELRSRGYWQVVIRPVTFDQKRIGDISVLLPIVERASVQLRGWDFPHVDRHEASHIDVDWVGQESRWQHTMEAWRLYLSGQFVDVSALWEDWRDRSEFWPPKAGWQSGQFVGIGETLFRFTEILEFAARLSLSDAGDESMHVEVSLNNLAGRHLLNDDPNRLFRGNYKASIATFPFSLDVSRADLVANSRSHAVNASAELFKRFGLDASKDMLREWQAGLRTS